MKTKLLMAVLAILAAVIMVNGYADEDYFAQQEKLRSELVSSPVKAQKSL